jgi:CRISPR-associated RAMP protein (TIGR02581 family)
MHKARYNAVRLLLDISPHGSLLIKAGGFSANPSLPDMQFVRTYQAGTDETVYIPGASLKGVVRGFVEKALRTLDDHTTWRWACPTFEGKKNEEHNCPQHLRETEQKEKELESWKIYRSSCGACRLFGHTRLRGRIAFTDLFPNSPVKTETRHGVAISRLTHAVAQGPFEMEVAVSGAFSGQVVLENYELWQLGLLATALEAMNQGFLKVGFGKNRGFGQVRIKIRQVYIEELVPLRQETTLRGLADFVDERQRNNYDLASPYTLTEVSKPIETQSMGFYLRRTYDSTAWRTIAQKAIQAL